MKMTFFQRVESRLVARVLGASDAFVERMTEPRWQVDGEALDRRTQYMFQVGRFAERSIPEMTPAAARRYYARLNRVLEADPQDLGEVADLTIAMRSGDRPARAYYPATVKASAQGLPGLMYIHGGGFSIGSIETHDTLCRRLCVAASCIVISIDYRLAPENPFPAAVEDCHDAYRWICRHAIRLGLRDDRIAVGGDSAGGNLSAVVSCLARDAGEPLPFALLLIYPVTANQDHVGRKKPELQTGYGLDAKTLAWFSKNYLPRPEERNPLASPLYLGSHVGLPPAIVVTAQFDLLCAEGIDYVGKLRAAGVPVVHQHLGDLPHGFSTMSVLPRARAAIEGFASVLADAFQRGARAADFVKRV